MKSILNASIADRQQRRAIDERRSKAHPRAEEKPQKVIDPALKFGNFVEFMVAVARGDLGRADARLVRAPTGAGEVDPAGGGFLVQQEFAEAILGRAYATGAILARIFPLPVAKGNSVRLPLVDETSRVTGNRFGGVSASWAAEGVQPAATQPKWRSVDLDLHKLIALTASTTELTEDSGFAVVTAEAVSHEIGFVTENAIFRGTGAGQPLGILNCPAKITVPKEAGQASGSLLKENIGNMFARMWGPSRETAVWVIHQDTEAQLQALDLPAGQLTYLPPEVPGGPRRVSLFGCPVILSEYAAAPGTEGDIVLADFSAYALADRRPDWSQSLHVRFNTFETTFRFTYRCSGLPLWNTPLTPANGSNTLSPFVTLANR